MEKKNSAPIEPKAIDILNHMTAEINGAVNSLINARELQGGSDYTIEQRLHAVEALLSAGLNVLNQTVQVLTDLQVSVEVFQDGYNEEFSEPDKMPADEN